MKTECESDDIAVDSLTGSVWELHSYGGGLRPGQTFQSGNGHLISFDHDIYTIYTNGAQVKARPYTIRTEHSFTPDGEIRPRIFCDDCPTTYYEISNGVLFLYIGAPLALDGTVTTYYKVKNDLPH